MQNKIPYWYYQNLLSPEECDKIIQLGNSKTKETASTFGNEEKGNDDRISKQELTNSQLKNQNIPIEKTYIRDSQVTWLTDEWLYNLLVPKVYEANQKAGWNYDIDSFENIQFTCYNSPGGFYGWHTDGNGDIFASYKRYIAGVSPVERKPNGGLPHQWTEDHNMVGKVRKISITINLSNENDYDGGLLKFDFGEHSAHDQFHLCEEISPRGSMIVFPSYLPHCVTPVTSGTRYSLVMWCLGRPFK